jgi:hypothetical protein
MQQIQQAHQVIMQEAPELASLMGMPAGGVPPTAHPPTTGTATNPTDSTANMPMRGVMDFASMLQNLNLVSCQL